MKAKLCYNHGIITNKGKPEKPSRAVCQLIKYDSYSIYYWDMFVRMSVALSQFNHEAT